MEEKIFEESNLNRKFSALFKAIAIIHIYFHCDLKFKYKAYYSWEYLRKNNLDRFENLIFKSEEQKKSYESIKNLSFGKIKHYDDIFRVMYHNLFESIILKFFPNACFSVDFYGAYCVVINGKAYFNGDDYDEYPFYADLQSLLAAIRDVREEIEFEQ